MKVVLDAGPLIHLSWIDRLSLLDMLFDEVLLPLAVRDEVLAPPAGTLGLERIREGLARGRWTVRDAPAADHPRWVPAGHLGRGEVDALRLAEEIGADLFVTDDAAARRWAAQRGLDTTGTLGVLKAAREVG